MSSELDTGRMSGPANEERRREIAAITQREIERVGLEGVTMRGIARAGRFSTGAVSHYFVDKQDLLLATYEAIGRDLWTRVERMTAAGESTLRAIIAASLPLDDEVGSAWRASFAFWSASYGDDDIRRLQAARVVAFRDSIDGALREEVAAGRIAPEVDITRERRRLMAVIYGIAVQVVFDPDSWSPETQWQVMEDHLRSIDRP